MRERDREKKRGYHVLVAVLDARDDLLVAESERASDRSIDREREKEREREGTMYSWQYSTPAMICWKKRRASSSDNLTQKLTV